MRTYVIHFILCVWDNLDLTGICYHGQGEIEYFM